MGTGVEVVLKNDRGGGSVEPCLASPPVLDRDGQTALGLAAAQAFVLKHYWKPGQAAKRLRECPDAGRHVIGGSVEARRQADDQRGHAVLLRAQPCDLGCRYARGVGFEAGGPEYTHRSGESTCRIANRHTDATRTDVEPDNTHAIILSLFHT